MGPGASRGFSMGPGGSGGVSMGPGGSPGGEGSPGGSLAVRIGEGRALRALGGWELVRALLVLRLCAHPWLVDNAETLLRGSRRVLPLPLWRGLLALSLFGQFAVGRGQRAVRGVAERLRGRGLRPMLALPLEGEGPEGEGESWFEANRGAALQCVGLAAGAGPEPAMQLKVTALLSHRLCIPNFPGLSPPENRHLGGALRRLDDVIKAAVAGGVRVLVDAELSHLNPALTCVTLGLMWRHNRQGALPWVWNTYQAYLQDAEGRLRADSALCAEVGVAFGAKLVRGAYLEHERARAAAGGRQPPTWGSPELTSASFRRCLDWLLPLLPLPRSRLGVVVATHNEASVLHTARRMEELSLPRSGGPVCFAQLLGMGDHISLALGELGFQVYKSVPVGPPEVTVPYLARRAAENRGALGGARRERELLGAELRRRLRPWQ
ncbi:hydroxyproline dehydrogenase-like isoform X2 [Manacus candei]|uniref:hydroxyproline dehydrogenase-like isoform X2 n=1 Tax=Manacus candei TaxID=415023 RepID=UPI0022261CE8|nr:hydroxyproline dehydrogenase-like isoform X2 [Manacus candei]